MCAEVWVSAAATMLTSQSFTNSLGMKFVLIKTGESTMGGLHDELPAGLANEGFMRDGDADGRPAHKVTFSNHFYVGPYEVTNTQFEQFDPSHRLVRGKPGVSRDFPLWPETVESLEKIPRTGKLVFYTSRGNPYMQTLVKPDGNGNGKYTTLNSITTKFSRLIKKSGLDVPKGTGFYALRRTAATIAARSGDPFAVQRLLGHANLKMATGCVQDVSKQTDKVIENSRKYVI
jgi:hypothetical protein